MNRFYRVLSGTLLGVVCGACLASEVPVSPGIIPADVMGRMTDAQAPSGVSVRRWFDPVLETTKYRQAMIDQVVYFPRRPIASEQLSDSVIDHLPVALTEVLKVGVGQSFSIASKTGPDTLRLRAAIVGISAETESFKAKELLPIRLIFSAFEAAVGERTKEPVVELHWALHDAASDRLLAAGIRRGVGDAINKDAPKITADMLKPVIEGWVNDTTDGLSKILH